MRPKPKPRGFFHTPKGLLTVVLAILIAMSVFGQDARAVAVGLFSSTTVAGLADMVIRRVRTKAWEFPSGAVLTAAIVVMVLRAQEPWYVSTVTSVIAVLSKYVFRLRKTNLFNPAALAVVASYYLFHAGQSWWGALSDEPGMAKLVLVGMGVFIANRVNKMPLALTFLGAYFVLFTITAFVGNPLTVAEVFRTPDAEAVLYFAFFILTDPPTSPTKYRDQIICGLIVAVVSYGCFQLAGVVYFLLAGVLVGNVWEAWRRASRRSGYTFPKGLGAFLREIGPWRRAGIGIAA
jgi:Na+-translocating ferredoxin:NAD+ oxidoreductase RnfD subunit